VEVPLIFMLHAQCNVKAMVNLVIGYLPSLRQYHANRSACVCEQLAHGHCSKAEQSEVKPATCSSQVQSSNQAPSSHNVSVCRLLITNRQLLEYVKELKITGTDFVLK